MKSRSYLMLAKPAPYLIRAATIIPNPRHRQHYAIRIKEILQRLFFGSTNTSGERIIFQPKNQRLHELQSTRSRVFILSLLKNN